MKKYLLLGSLALLLVGCGNKGNQVVCTATQSEGGVSVEVEVTADLDKDNKVSDVNMVYIFDSEDKATSYCQILELGSQYTTDEDEKIDYTCSGKKISIKGAMGEDDSIIGRTKDEFIKELEANDYKCK